MAHRFNGRGSWVIDKRYKSIGRVRRASGAKTKKTFDAILKMLEILHEQGKHTILREIQAGIVSPIEAFGYWREDKLEYLPSTETLKKLSPTFDEWVETYNVVPITRRNYKSAVKTFVSTVGNVPIQELPKAIKKYKKHCLHRNTPRAFSSLRTPILSFLRDTFGRHSVLYASVSEIKKLAEHDEEDGNQAPQLTVKEAQSLLKALPPQHGTARPDNGVGRVRSRSRLAKLPIRPEHLPLIQALMTEEEYTEFLAKLTNGNIPIPSKTKDGPRGDLGPV